MAVNPLTQRRPCGVANRQTCCSPSSVQCQRVERSAGRALEGGGAHSYSAFRGRIRLQACDPSEASREILAAHPAACEQRRLAPQELHVARPRAQSLHQGTSYHIRSTTHEPCARAQGTPVWLCRASTPRVAGGPPQAVGAAGAPASGQWAVGGGRWAHCGGSKAWPGCQMLAAVWQCGPRWLSNTKTLAPGPGTAKDAPKRRTHAADGRAEAAGGVERLDHGRHLQQQEVPPRQLRPAFLL